jgi:hypothetical protein
MVDNIKLIKPIQNLKNQKGQAIFELLIFLPFLIFLYSIYYTAGNSISASINQQKAVRGYFYSLTKGNSYLNTYPDLKSFAESTLVSVGFSAIGWREREVNTKGSTAPCFKFSSLLKNESTEECDSADRPEENSSRFIRIFTFYGVCGPVYKKTTDPFGEFFEIPANAQSIHSQCSLSSEL